MTKGDTVRAMKCPSRFLLLRVAFAFTLLASFGAWAEEASTEPAAATKVAPAPEDPLGKRAWELMTAGKLMTADVFSAQEKAPQPGPVELEPRRTAPLSGREMARHAAASYLRAGWFFQCTRCDKWHTNFSGGYAIAKDAAVTAHHVMQPPQNAKQGTAHAILVRGESEVLPVVAVIADDATTDAVVLRVGVNDLKPLPLAAEVQAGDSVWCLSDPHGARGYLSNGIVNRLYVREPGKGENDPRTQRLNVSTDWAPGSSGAAVLDGCGNVVGHVGSIQGFLGQPKPDAPKQPVITEMVLHEGIPAKSVLTLINK